jgi:hypothetical protein
VVARFGSAHRHSPTISTIFVHYLIQAQITENFDKFAPFVNFMYTPPMYFLIKGNPMDNRMIPVILSAVGVIFIMAMAFDIMANNVAIFLAIACFIIAGVFRSYTGKQDQTED